MNLGVIATIFIILVQVGVTAYLIGTMVRSIRNEKHTSMSLWKNFGLSLGFCVLFLVSWAAHGVAQWQTYTDQQKQHGEEVETGDFLSEFSQATLENWQSEFLQLFSFTVMAAILIHKGSAESRDSDDRIAAALKRIEDQLGTEPTLRTDATRQSEDLHVVPDEAQGWSLRGEATEEPEGYYDLQEEAIAAGRELARIKGVKLVIHSPDATVRETIDTHA